jgi:sulfotransferase family protein
MLYRYLGEHPLVSALSGTPRPANEGQHNQTVYPADTYHSKAGRFAFRPEARLTETSPLVTEANRRKLFEEWSRFWDTSCLYLLEKSPPNLIRMRFLQAMFPNSYFVAMLRHPIPNTLATLKWDPQTPPHRIAAHWLRAHELFASDVQHVRRLHVLRYEDLVDDPDTVLGRVFEFLELDDPGAGRERGEGVNADNFQSDRTLRTGVNERYFDDWRRRRSGAFGRAYYEALERWYEHRVRAFGYSLREPAVLRAPTVLLPGLGAGARQPAHVA